RQYFPFSGGAWGPGVALHCDRPKKRGGGAPSRRLPLTVANGAGSTPNQERAARLSEETCAHPGQGWAHTLWRRVCCALRRSLRRFLTRGRATGRDRARWLLTTALTSHTAMLLADRS